jgi:hypothetical protein
MRASGSARCLTPERVAHPTLKPPSILLPKAGCSPDVTLPAVGSLRICARGVPRHLLAVPEQDEGAGHYAGCSRLPALPLAAIGPSDHALALNPAFSHGEGVASPPNPCLALVLPCARMAVRETTAHSGTGPYCLLPPHLTHTV